MMVMNAGVESRLLPRAASVGGSDSEVWMALAGGGDARGAEGGAGGGEGEGSAVLPVGGTAQDAAARPAAAQAGIGSGVTGPRLSLRDAVAVSNRLPFTGRAAARSLRHMAAVGESIAYHGGRLLVSSPLNVYLLFYGSWGPGTGMEIVKGFVRALNDTSVSAPSVSSWWEISTAYHNGDGKHVSAQVRRASLLRRKSGSMRQLPGGRLDTN